MAQHDRRRAVETLDQQTALVVDREAEGATNPPHPSLAQPLFRDREQGSEGFRMVLRLQHAEKTGGIMVSLQMQLIDLGTDAPYHPLATAGNPGLEFGMPEIGVLGGKVPFPFDDQWRNPAGIPRIQRPGHFDEAAQQATTSDGDDPQRPVTVNFVTRRIFHSSVHLQS